MGLFIQRPEQNEEWAGLPSEPARAETEAERLAEAAPMVDALGLDGFGSTAGGAVESIVIPVTRTVEVAQPAVTDGDGDDAEGDDDTDEHADTDA
ncbi:hypothetical protein [Microbacterium sp. HJ5]